MTPRDIELTAANAAAASLAQSFFTVIAILAAVAAIAVVVQITASLRQRWEAARWDREQTIEASRRERDELHDEFYRVLNNKSEPRPAVALEKAA